VDAPRPADDPRSRLERALDRAPLLAREVDPRWFDEREDLADQVMAAHPLPEGLVEQLLELPEATREDFIEQRFLVAATEPGWIERLDRVLLAAAHFDLLVAAIEQFGAQLREGRLGSTAVALVEGWYAEQTGA
jgi:hypothetical protein